MFLVLYVAERKTGGGIDDKEVGGVGCLGGDKEKLSFPPRNASWTSTKPIYGLRFVYSRRKL